MKPSMETVALIRFGYGISALSDTAPTAAASAATVATATTVAAGLMAQLTAPDGIAQALPIAPFSQREAESREMAVLRRARKLNEDGALEALKAARQKSVYSHLEEMRTAVLRPMLSPDGFRERLFRFWSDHFTVAGRDKGLRFIISAYNDEAIRPHIAGNFRDLLRAAVTHPAMLIYLDQVLSIGPTSAAGSRTGRGLNENLAREILELHTLGVGSSYRQQDVRQFAELLTGLMYDFKNGFRFRANAAEPGAETILGQSYGGDKARIDDIYQALDDLALHPDTARHIARKLAVHFISDAPDPGLVAAIAAAYRDSQGDLMASYEAMLTHPLAWQGFGAKAKQPFDFMVSSLRAFGTTEAQMTGLKIGELRRYLAAPMEVMGQPWQRAPGPDGWPEDIDDWITPQGLAARVQWALIATDKLASQTDPAVFAGAALREVADDGFRRTIGFSESRLEGMALVLASPQFNRR